jgi:hypothetical protein
MSTRTYNQRFASCADLESSVRRYLPPLRPRADELLGEGAADKFIAAIDVATSYAVRCWSRVEKAECAFKTLRAEKVQATASRDRHTRECHDLLVKLRTTVEGFFGEPYAKLLGFAGPTPEEPVGVSRMAREVTTNVKKAELPATRTGETAVDPVALVQRLAEPAGLLRESIGGAMRAQDAVDLARVERKRAIAEYDPAFSAASTFLVTFLELCGEQKLARNVRQQARRRRNGAKAAAGDESVSQAAADSGAEAGSKNGETKVTAA